MRLNDALRSVEICVTGSGTTVPYHISSGMCQVGLEAAATEAGVAYTLVAAAPVQETKAVKYLQQLETEGAKARAATKRLKTGALGPGWVQVISAAPGLHMARKVYRPGSKALDLAVAHLKEVARRILPDRDNVTWGVTVQEHSLRTG